jgi:hypothetical protein
MLRQRTPGREADAWRRGTPWLLAWLAAGILGIDAARADIVYAVSDFSQNLATLDPATGQVFSSVVIPTGGTNGTNGANRDITPDINHPGQLLLSAFRDGIIASHQLFRLDPATGNATLLGDFTNGAGMAYWVEGMAYVHGVLYASAARIDISSGTPIYLSYAPDTSDALLRIDPATGHATQVGLFGPQFLNMQNIAWSPRYGLIGADIGTLDPATNFSTFHTTPALVSIDPNTGIATKIADLPHGGLISNPFNSILSPSGPFVAGLDFSPDGNTLFGGTIQTHFRGTGSGLVTIDPTTGALTQIRDAFGSDPIPLPAIVGITFPTITVPEPTSLALLALGAPGVFIAARGRRARVRTAGAD